MTNCLQMERRARKPLHDAAHAAQIAIVIMHLSRRGVNSDAIVILMAAQCILLWLRLQYYLRQAATPCFP